MSRGVRARTTTAALLLAVVAGAACSAFPRDVRIVQASASDLERTVTMSVDSCNADVSASAEEHPDRVEVTVRARNVTRDDCADPAAVELDDALGDRDLVDASTGEVVAVGNADTGEPALAPERPPVPAEALVDRTHELVSVDGEPARSVGEDAPRLRLREDLTFVVSGGCNHRVGTYEIDPDGVHVGIDPVDTVRRCRDGVLDTQEQRVFAVFSASASVTTDGDRVTVSAEGTELAYELLSDAPDVEVAGATWRLERIIGAGGEEVPVTTPAALELTDGVLTAETGCNDLGAEAILLGDELRFPVGASATEAGCATPGDEAQERAVGSVLFEEAVDVHRDGDRLELAGGGTTLTYSDGG